MSAFPALRGIAALRARAQHLRENGIPAIAELDEGRDTDITMPFTRPGVEPFVAAVVGVRFTALIDPHDSPFRVLRRGRRRPCRRRPARYPISLA